MRLNCLLLLLVLTSPMSSAAQLTVRWTGCWDNTETIMPYVNWYRNDSLVAETEFMFVEIEEERLPPGTYLAEYETLFGDTIRREITVKPDTMTIAFDALYLPEEKQPEMFWLDTLKHEDTLRIDCTERGCRMPEFTSTLSVYKKGKGTYAEFEGKTIRLDKEQIMWLHTFESQLKNIRRYGCTSSDQYTVSVGNKHILDVTDRSCRLYAFDGLLVKLGLEDE